MKETKLPQIKTAKAILEIVYENYGLNGENPEGDVIIVNVISKNIERAIAKFRSTLPKSLEYQIIAVHKSEYELIM